MQTSLPPNEATQQPAALHVEHADPARACAFWRDRSPGCLDLQYRGQAITPCRRCQRYAAACRRFDRLQAALRRTRQHIETMLSQDVTRR